MRNLSKIALVAFIFFGCGVESNINGRNIEKAQCYYERLTSMILVRCNDGSILRVPIEKSFEESDNEAFVEVENNDVCPVEGGNIKVVICHKNKKTLSVSSASLDAHLNHGDTIGECFI